MPGFIAQMMQFPWVQALGVIVTFATALQAVFMFFGQWVPGLKKASTVIGVFAQDIGKLISLVSSYMAKRNLQKSANVSIVLMLTAVAVCVGCASFGKFSPGASSAVQEACTVLDSGNPEIGTICLTAEEITSIFSHVKATRARMSVSPTETRKVDICDAPADEQ